VQHKQEGEWGEGKDQSWPTKFHLCDTIFYQRCNFCCQQLEQQLENWKTFSPDHPVSVLFTSAQISAIEFKFINVQDDMSEWTYWIWHRFLEKERKELGSSV
jgi:hypothetical protein